MIAGSYPIWILMDSHVVNCATFMCSVRYRCRSPECADQGGGVNLFLLVWYYSAETGEKWEKKERLCRNTGKMAKKSGKRAKIQVKYRKMLLKLCVFAILR
jgi:hypothetical protein